jgi:hypothetical protein
MIAAQGLTDNEHVAARITNLGIVAARAYFHSHETGEVLDGHSVEQRMREISLFPFPRLSKSGRKWDAFADVLKSVSGKAFTARDFDLWVEAWQAADPGRKSRGAYATPSVFANELAYATLSPYLGIRRVIRVVDPSAGAGALLLAAFRVLSAGKTGASRRKILRGLHGVELDPISRELCCLMLWLESGAQREDLDIIATNIQLGESLGRDWWRNGEAPYDALIMNPPWESLRHAIEESAPHSASRAATIKRLTEEKDGAAGLPPLFTAQGTGDRNLFKAFMELAPHLLKEGGRYGALVPSAFASDLGMAVLRDRYFKQLKIETWTGFENLRKHFLIDARYKFGLLVGARSVEGTRSFRVKSFAADPEEVRSKHAVVTVDELWSIGGPSRMIPELQDQQEKDILVRALASGSSFFMDGSFGKVVYKREVDLTMGLTKGQFGRLEDCGPLNASADGTFSTPKQAKYVPVMEGRMVGQYDVFQKSWIGGKGRTAQWRSNGPMALGESRPQYVSKPRPEGGLPRIAICDVTSATNNRTVHATWVPSTWWCGNTAPVLEFQTELHALAALGVLNSMVFDWLTRRVVGGLHLNKFYLEALAWPHFEKADLLTVAEAAAALCKRNKRFAAAGGDSFLARAGVKSGSHVRDAAVRIEIATARGFGLNANMLTRMFNPSTMDRRGFWRYFASDHDATSVAEKALNHLAANENEQQRADSVDACDCQEQGGIHALNALEFEIPIGHVDRPN